MGVSRFLNCGEPPPMKVGANSAAKRFWLPVSMILVIQIALGISTADRFGITYDEYNHLPVGLLNL